MKTNLLKYLAISFSHLLTRVVQTHTKGNLPFIQFVLYSICAVLLELLHRLC